MGEHVPKETNEHAAGSLVEKPSITNEDSTQEVRPRLIRMYSSKLECKANPFALRPGRELEWTNVNVLVARKEEADIQVLQGISGKVQPRQLTCIMGHSGSGYVQLFKLYRSHCSSFHSPPLYFIRFVCLIKKILAALERRVS
jgi:ABC-type multidrug transport system fused ATPase/permease subunit